MSKTVPLLIRGEIRRIDSSFSEIVSILNATSIKTSGCCSGITIDHPDNNGGRGIPLPYIMLFFPRSMRNMNMIGKSAKRSKLRLYERETQHLSDVFEGDLNLEEDTLYLFYKELRKHDRIRYGITINTYKRKRSLIRNILYRSRDNMVKEIHEKVSEAEILRRFSMFASLVKQHFSTET